VETRRRWLLTGVVAAELAYVVVRNLDVTPYDDAYFFKRFALNFLHHGSLAWNPPDGPVHGLTSQLFAIVAVGLAALAPAHFVVATKVFLALCLAATAWLVSGLALRITGRFDVAAALTLLALGNPLVSWCVHTGMETALAILCVTLALGATLEAELTPRHAARAALLGVLVYLCRPDAAIIPVLAFLGVNVRNRRAVAVYGVTFALALGACLLVFRLYYGTALPLPFYLKTAGWSRYETAVTRLGMRDKLVHLATFALFAAPFVWLLRRGSRAGLALGVAALGFVAYHALFTTEIMGYRSRFYAPALIPLGLGAAFGSGRALTSARSQHAWFFAAWVLLSAAAYHFGVVAAAASAAPERLLYPVYVTHAALAGWLLAAGDEQERRGLFGLIALSALGTLAALPPRNSAFPSDREFLAKSSSEVTTTRGIFDVERCLPLAKNVYHSEIGVPGLLLPETRIVDLAGLMSRSLALEHPSFDSYCTRDRPEALFLPHQNYADLNREIAGSRCIADYTKMVQRSSSPLYVRNDLADDFRRCARDIQRWQ